VNANWKRIMALTGVLAAVALIGAGCGDDDGDEGAMNTTEEAVGEAVSTDTGAATLRADLTALLDEHVQLAGIAIVKGVQDGLDSPEFEAAADTLDQNSQGLADAIGTVYGEEARDQFLELWRTHIGFFVDYTEGKASGDEAKAKQARQDLEGYKEDFGAFLSSANPNLTKQAVSEALGPHTSSVFEAIDAVATGNGDPFAALQAAVDEMPAIAAVLAGAIAEQNSDQFDGQAESGASELRATLTHLLQQHVYAAGIAVDTGVGAGLDSPEFEAAAGALDRNSVALADAIGSVYGKPAGDQFLELWRAHIGFFVDYTAAQAEGDEKAANKAKRDLDGYREDFGAFLESANPNLTKEAVAEELQPHVESLFTAIDSVLAAQASAFEDLRTAAGHMPGTANVLAGGIVAQSPEMFGG